MLERQTLKCSWKTLLLQAVMSVSSILEDCDSERASVRSSRRVSSMAIEVGKRAIKGTVFPRLSSLDSPLPQ